MVGVYRVFRAAVTFALIGVAATLFGGLVLAVATDRGVSDEPVVQLNEDWNPLTIAELVPGFWPTLLFATGLTIGMWLEAGALRRNGSSQKQQGPLEIVYDPSDHQFVYREFPNGQLKPITHFAIGIRSGPGNRPLEDIVVSASRNAFVKAMVEPVWGAPTHQIKRIEPNVTKFVEFLQVPDAAHAPGMSNGLKVQHFVIRARAKDARRTSAKFEFNACATPMIRRLV